MLFFKNPPNPLLKDKEGKLTPEYTPAQWTLLTLLWLILFPLTIPLWIIWRVFSGAVVASGMAVFWMAQRLFFGMPDKAAPFRRQQIRAYINNTIGVSLPHWNAPFRRFLFRLTGVRIGRGSFIGMGGYMEDYRPENVLIEDNVSVSFGVTFVGHGKKQGKSSEELFIILREGAYVGARSVLLPGVEVGKNAIIGAGSVVTKDVPAGAVVAGNPARILRSSAE